MIRRDFLKLGAAFLLPLKWFGKRKRTALDLFGGDRDRWARAIVAIQRSSDLPWYKIVYKRTKTGELEAMPWPSRPRVGETVCRFSPMEEHASLKEFEWSVRERFVALVDYCRNKHWGVGRVVFVGTGWHRPNVPAGLGHGRRLL